MSDGRDRPDPSQASTPAELVDAMRRLKRWSGLGFRTLQKRARAAGADLPRSTLTAVLARETLPRVDLLAAFARTCGCDEPEVGHWIAARRRIAAKGHEGPPAASPAPVAVAATWVVPAQLPAPAPGFVGRAGFLRELGERLPGTRENPAVSIVTVTGMAGVGKTSLAVHWAHTVADQFPDGRLYANLRGFAAGQAALTPAEALSGFLHAFALPSERIPAQFEAQIGLYRSLMAGRRMLVLLDNAFDDEHVLPLLPAAPGCMAVVTSRRRLSGLVASGAHPLVLETLPPAEARDLLVRRVGGARIGAEPDAVEEILGSCVRLPLALSIVAARAATHPQFSLAHFAGELRDARGRLDALGGGDPRSDIRTVFSWSYLALRPEAAKLFRLLGVHPGPDIGVGAAASIAAMPVAPVRRLLDELSYAHLVDEHRPGRFVLHDLLRDYAGERAREVDGEDSLAAARHRLLDHYLHSACQADRVLYPNRDPIAVTDPCPGVLAESPGGVDEALSWFAGEHQVLKAVIAEAVARREDNGVWQLAWAMANYLERKGHWQDWRLTQELALRAAERIGDTGLLAEIHRSLGRVHARLGNEEDTHTHFKQALEFGDPITRAHTHINLCQALEQQQRYPEAQIHARQALALYQAHRHPLGQGNALNTIGWLEIMLGDPASAIGYCRQALEMHERLGHRYGQCNALDSLAVASRQLGQYSQAAGLFHRALEVNRGIGDRYSEAAILHHLGELQSIADPPAAHETLRAALSILEQLRHGDAEAVRDLLRALSLPGPDRPR